MGSPQMDVLPESSHPGLSNTPDRGIIKYTGQLHTFDSWIETQQRCPHTPHTLMIDSCEHR